MYCKIPQSSEAPRIPEHRFDELLQGANGTMPFLLEGWARSADGFTMSDICVLMPQCVGPHSFHSLGHIISFVAHITWACALCQCMRVIVASGLTLSFFKGFDCSYLAPHGSFQDRQHVCHGGCFNAGDRRGTISSRNPTINYLVLDHNSLLLLPISRDPSNLGGPWHLDVVSAPASCCERALESPSGDSNFNCNRGLLKSCET